MAGAGTRRKRSSSASPRTFSPTRSSKSIASKSSTSLMQTSCNRWPNSRNARAFVFLLPILLLFSGCQKTLRVDDPRLKPIQELLDAKLPPGTTQDQVISFLNERGYVVVPPEKKGTIITIMLLAEAPQKPPIVGRVTFYFDANGKLNTFAIRRPADPPRPTIQ